MSSNLFEKIFKKLLREEMTAATTFGPGSQTNQGGAIPGGSDFYAPGDARVPKALGATKKKPGKIHRRNLTSM